MRVDSEDEIRFVEEVNEGINEGQNLGFFEDRRDEHNQSFGEDNQQPRPENDDEEEEKEMPAHIIFPMPDIEEEEKVNLNDLLNRRPPFNQLNDQNPESPKDNIIMAFNMASSPSFNKRLQVCASDFESEESDVPSEHEKGMDNKEYTKQY